MRTVIVAAVALLIGLGIGLTLVGKSAAQSRIPYAPRIADDRGFDSDSNRFEDRLDRRSSEEADEPSLRWNRAESEARLGSDTTTTPPLAFGRYQGAAVGGVLYLFDTATGQVRESRPGGSWSQTIGPVQP